MTSCPTTFTRMGKARGGHYPKMQVPTTTTTTTTFVVHVTYIYTHKKVDRTTTYNFSTGVVLASDLILVIV